MPWKYFDIVPKIYAQKKNEQEKIIDKKWRKVSAFDCKFQDKFLVGNNKCEQNCLSDEQIEQKKLNRKKYHFSNSTYLKAKKRRNTGEACPPEYKTMGALSRSARLASFKNQHTYKEKIKPLIFLPMIIKIYFATNINPIFINWITKYFFVFFYLLSNIFIHHQFFIFFNILQNIFI